LARTWFNVFTTASIVALSGCQPGNLISLKEINPFANGSVGTDEGSEVSEDKEEGVLLSPSVLSSTDADVNFDAGFVSAMRQAIMNDPYVLSAQNEAASAQARVQKTKSQKEFNYDAKLMGGIEDVTDEIAGVAAILSARRPIYDGGKIDAQIAADEYTVRAAEYTVTAMQNERGVTLANAWIELERYRRLRNLIDSRLEVLDPLVSQLEAVAKSGVGDASQVAAAQRTVSMIRVTQIDVFERYEQAKIEFLTLFGKLPGIVKYDAAMLAKALPTGEGSALVQAAPTLMARYNEYRSSEAFLLSIKALDKFDVGFEAKAQKPLGGSNYSSDESVGLILSKTFYRGNQLKSQIESAEAITKSKAEQVRATFRKGELELNSARQMILSMDKAVVQARDNARITQDEISYLRKQLVIGGSTLDSVLSAEARLYDAQSKEISFQAERRKAEVTILGITGKLTAVLQL
jgi:adhesin transport system outer membrane protein